MKYKLIGLEVVNIKKGQSLAHVNAKCNLDACKLYHIQTRHHHLCLNVEQGDSGRKPIDTINVFKRFEDDIYIYIYIYIYPGVEEVDGDVVQTGQDAW